MELRLTEEEYADLAVVFPGGPVTQSVDEMVGVELAIFRERLAEISNMRWYCAVTGAMRWPWSQEARLCDGSAMWME